MKKYLLFTLCILFSFNLSSQEKNLSEGPFEQLIIRGATLINGNGSPPLGPVDIVIEKNIIKSCSFIVSFCKCICRDEHWYQRRCYKFKHRWY